MTNYEKLREKLEEMFMLDRADLDFGIYRIMNSKRDEILRFLDHDLLPQVKKVLIEAQGEISVAGEDELKEAESQARSLGVDPASVPKVQELRKKYGQTGDVEALAQEVFNHLYSFFRRYYDEGDFLSLRRYKEGVYAIPYEGEEVKLHWANADQYYIKTTEHFRDYTFKAGDDRRVLFKLVDAEVEKDNNKASQKRVFILKAEDPISEEEGELVIRFEYRAAPDKRKQKDHSEESVSRILAESPAAWHSALQAKAPTEKHPNRTLVEKHLTDYTARNTFDYFIHKDLGGFLRRELDFYIKNEVMHLDDIEHETAPKVEQYLAKVKAIRRVASKLIDFLAQLEDFQKRLWLKKKFVVESSYILSLDRIPEDFYATIAANEAQRNEWNQLYSISDANGLLTAPDFTAPLPVEFLKNNLNLLVDTRHFSDVFQRELQSTLDLSSWTGMCIKSDNFQALRLLSTRFQSQVDCIYIDPPYNTDASPILYKNGFKSSTWISLLHDRLKTSRRLLSKTGALVAAIDDEQYRELSFLISSTLRSLGVICVRSNPSGRPTKTGYSVSHEYLLFGTASDSANIGRLPPTPEQLARFSQTDETGNFEWRNLRREGSNSDRSARRKLFYPIYITTDSLRVPKMTWDDFAEDWIIEEQPEPGEQAVLPINDEGEEKTWRWEGSTVMCNLHQLAVRKDRSGKNYVYYKRRPNEAGVVSVSSWFDAKYSATEHGTGMLKTLFGNSPFSYPKSLHSVVDAVYLAGGSRCDAIILDYFAGSGTTSHAVMHLNRLDGGSRRFVQVEMGSYFDSVLLPRVKKVAYSATWDAGKPLNRDSGVSQLIKVLRLESYEDSSANIRIQKPVQHQQELLDSNIDIREDYLLRYTLDSETLGSPSLINTQGFDHPFEYTLKASTDTVGETMDVNVDLAETFNWLLGLRVHTMDVIRGFHVVTGRLPGPGNSENGEKALIIWRDVDENPNDKLEEFFRRQAYNTQDQEFDVIYVNGDNNLQNQRKDDQTWKVRLIEEEFHRLMWDVEDV